MTAQRATVFGGTGLLGRHIVACLAEAGMRIRVAVRHPERIPTGDPSTAADTVEAIGADVRDQASVARAVAGADAVVNAAGLYVEREDETFDSIHVQGARHVAHQSNQAGAARLVHISGIGADAASPSKYVRARAEGEAAVRNAFDGANILRPNALFGAEGDVITALTRVARAAPIMPLFGTGETKLQPVHVADVAQAVRAVLTDPATRGRVYELGGPRIYTYKALLTMVVKQTGRLPILLPLPYALWDGLAAMARLLPTPPLTGDQVTLMKTDNVADPDAPGLATLGITPMALEDVLHIYVR